MASVAVFTAAEAIAAHAEHHGEAISGHVNAAVDHVVDAAHHGDAHGADHGSAGLPQFDPSTYPSQLFWLTITFLVLYIFFAKSVLPSLGSTIESRRDHIQNDLDTAKTMKDEAEKVQAAYEEALTESRNEASALMAQSEEKIKAKAAKKLDTLRQKAADKMQDAESKIEKAKTEALKDMDAIAAEVASEAAEKIVGIKADIKKAKTVIDNINKKAA